MLAVLNLTKSRLLSGAKSRLFRAAVKAAGSTKPHQIKAAVRAWGGGGRGTIGGWRWWGLTYISLISLHSFILITKKKKVMYCYCLVKYTNTTQYNTNKKNKERIF